MDEGIGESCLSIMSFPGFSFFRVFPCNSVASLQVSEGVMAYETVLRERFGEGSFTMSAFRDNRRVIVAPDRLHAFLDCLKNQCGFDMLAELTAVDYLNYPGARDRFGVVYGLLNVASGERVYVKTYLN